MNGHGFHIKLAAISYLTCYLVRITINIILPVDLILKDAPVIMEFCSSNNLLILITLFVRIGFLDPKLASSILHQNSRVVGTQQPHVLSAKGIVSISRFSQILHTES